MDKAPKGAVKWGGTMYGHHFVRIWKYKKNHKTAAAWMTGPDAEGTFYVHLTPYCFLSQQVLMTYLCHEFVHIIESCVKKEELSPKVVNNCTHLARTIGFGMAHMLSEFVFAETPRRRKR